MEFLLFIIFGLVAGYFFLTKFNKIDNALFSSIENYQPFGISIVYISACAGAIFGCMFLYDQLSNNSTTLLSHTYSLIFIYLVMMICTSIFQAFLYMENVGAIIGKTMFMSISCILAMGIGFMASIVIITLVILLFIATLMGKAAFNIGESNASENKEDETIIASDENGNLINLHRKGRSNILTDNYGHDWIDLGGGHYERLNN